MSADTLEPQPPFDWIPDVFRNMCARDDDGVLYRIDWSVPGGRWAPVDERPAFELRPPPTGSQP